MSRFDRLFVIWRAAAGTRHVIGELWRHAEGFAFAYLSDLRAPLEDGFFLLPEFSRHATTGDPYVSHYLFPTFAQRIPSVSRADRQELLTAWGVENSDDPLEVLARSGGIQITDRLELAEHRSDDDSLVVALEMRIAGMKYYPGAENIAEGDHVELVREPTNPHDPLATIILAREGLKVGYVPRQYARLVAQHLDRGAPLDAVAVRRLTLPPDGGRWVVRVTRSQFPAPR